MVVYNTTALVASSDETVLRADIRYFRRKSSPQDSSSTNSSSTLHDPMTSAVLLELTSRRFRQLGKHLLMTSRSTGWVSVDVTSSLRRLNRRRREQSSLSRRRRRGPSSRRRSSLLALTFGGNGRSGDGEGQGRGQHVATRLRRTVAELRLLSSPTLVVFSRRTTDFAADHLLPSSVHEHHSQSSTGRSSVHRHRHDQACQRQLFHPVVYAIDFVCFSFILPPLRDIAIHCVCWLVSSTVPRFVYSLTSSDASPWPWP